MKVLLVCALALLATAAFADFDLGDLPPCNYPTFYGNPAHSMSGKAWLGDCITQEDTPYPVNGDGCDDGVQFVGLPWMPCEMVSVIVTVHQGPNYPNNQQLWLNAWKDGNLDGDFCDELCDGNASEWIIQDALVTPGTYTFTFPDPGVFNLGIYDGAFRFRLTGRTIGRNGFGFYDPFDCPNSPMCGNFGADSLGEVEDYWIPDAQLQVTMSGFDAVPGDSRVTLNWSTATETSNDRFEILRDDILVQPIQSQGNTTTGNNYSWTDNGLVNGTLYTYTLIAVSVANQREVVGTANATPAVGVATASEYALLQNYPNPFNPSTSITFDLVENGNVSLRVFNMIGQEVATLVNSNLSSGRHTVNFDASNLPSGLYIYRIDANGFSDQKKMLLMK